MSKETDKESISRNERFLREQIQHYRDGDMIRDIYGAAISRIDRHIHDLSLSVQYPDGELSEALINEANEICEKLGKLKTKLEGEQ